MFADIPYVFPKLARGHGTPYPPFDPSIDEKDWADPNPPAADADGNVTYTVVGPGGNGFAPLTIPRSQAVKPNLFGHDDYPKAPPQLVATFNSGQSSVPVCDLADAQALAKELGADESTIIDVFASIHPSLNFVYPASDPTARAWAITVDGAPYQVTNLLTLKNANGVGAPGHWSGATWVSDLPAPNATSPAMADPIDMSKVPAGATVQTNVLTGVPKLFIPDVPVNPAPSGGSFNPAGDPTILDIQAGVKALRGVFHV